MNLHCLISNLNSSLNKQKKLNLKKIFFFVFLLNGIVSSQIKTNLEIAYSLIEESVIKIDSLNISEVSPVYIEISSPADFQFLNSKIISAFSNLGYKIQTEDNQSRKLVYTLTNIKTEYSEIFQNGLFGDYLTQRTITIYSLVNYTDDGMLKFSNELICDYTDTVNVDDINFVENPSLNFTKGILPKTPVLSNLLEPILVVGTLIITVILLFTVRGK